jgi:hypothetical protein
MLRVTVFGAMRAIVMLLTFCLAFSAQQLPPLRYHHAGNGPADPETQQRTFAACNLQADIAAPMIEGSWESLAHWQLAATIVCAHMVGCETSGTVPRSPKAKQI